MVWKPQKGQGCNAMTYREAENYLYEIPKFTKKNPMEHTRELMKRLGDPQDDFMTIHVAGSNGKGSVCAMLHSVLCETGHVCGLFTSPHLVSLTERFQIQKAPCSEAVFLEAFHQVLSVVKKMEEEGLSHPTFFEMIFAIGMMIFQKEKVEYLVLETGLGGRLDTTNCVKKPKLCVITSISLEHTEYLGDTLAAIAGEKAGIIKDGVPVIFDAKHKEVADVIFKAAEPKLAPVYPVYPGDIQIVDKKDGCMSFVFDLNGHKNPVEIPFVADYQAENGSLAMQAAEILIADGILTLPQFTEGMRKTVWAGRMQLLEPGVYVDGAHNADGIRVFLETAKGIGKEPKGLLFGMVKEKNYEACIEQIRKAGCFKKIVLTQIAGERMLPATEILKHFTKEEQAYISIEEKPKEAYRKIKEETGDGTVFCAGSLYLAGEIIRLVEKAE